MTNVLLSETAAKAITPDGDPVGCTARAGDCIGSELTFATSRDRS